jgi:large subunit ribosomal protein L10
LAITKERKQELVAQYNELLGKTAGIIVTENRGMSVAKLGELRAKLRESGSKYVITKNTLLTVALKESGWPLPEELLSGPVAVAFSDQDVAAMAKTILTFSKDNPDLFVVKGGVMAGTVFTGEQVQTISELPTMDEIRAQLAGLLVQPATGLVSVLNSATSQVVQVLQAYLQENGEGGEETAA